EAMEHRASLSLPSHPSPVPPLLLSLREFPAQRPVEEAFHCKLQSPVVVDKKTLVELQNFHPKPRQAQAAGAPLEPRSQDYIFGGILTVFLLFLADHSELKSRGQLRARDTVRVLICIESLCHRHTSLEVIAGLESNSKIFTVHVQGLLQLQAGQYTSIFVDNSSGAALTIQSGSDFMGMLMGA
ncbi:ADIPL protein, partial [Sylvia borin]|nr:ADIPL protein [Sylvia borin]